MMLQVIAYALGISIALSLAAFCAERLSAMLARPRRFLWAATMVLSILWPLGMMLWTKPAEVTDPAAAMAGLRQTAAAPVEQSVPVATAPPRARVPQAGAGPSARTQNATQAPMRAPEDRWTLRLPTDRMLLLAWAAVSAVLLLYLAGTDLLLRHRASRWRRVIVLDRQVLVSETAGPALLGAWRPKLVVPRWFLDEPAATQCLILEHEQQHLAARDPLLLRLALLSVAVVPWNLPLWWQLRRLRQAIELDCDARVLRAGAEARSYGEVLLAVTQRASGVPVGAIAMGEPVSALERRIRHLTAGPAPRSVPGALLAIAFCGVGISVAFALDAPALPRKAVDAVVHDPAPASPLQAAQGLPPPAAIEVATIAATVPAPSQPTEDLSAQWGKVKRFCVDCHNATDWAGGVDLSAMSLDNLGDDAEVWEAAVRRLRTGAMPPPGRQRPDQQSVYRMVDLLETKLDTAHFQSPREEGSGADKLTPGDMELASRLSSLLWGTSPDDELLRAASRGKLSQPSQLAAQVRRMLADPKAMSLVAGFGFKWLNLARMDEIEPHASLFADATVAPDVRPLLKREMELFLDSVLRSEQPVTALLTADYTYLNDTLARLYGIGSVEGDQFRRVKLPDTKRHGLLGKGAVLMVTALPDRSSPSMRGSWILTRLLGLPQYSRPPNVGVLAETADGKSAPLRERLAQHTKNPTCRACHGLMDPLGFALENFDTVGQYRERDPVTGEAVSTSGTLPDGTELTGPEDLRRMLLARPEQFVQTITEQLMAYALGRQVDWRDMPLVRQIVRNAAQDNYRFASIVSQIVVSDSFRWREPVAEAAVVMRPTPE
jgi:beta-lactamase regulating signal transducer with metallopeptidase domain